MRCEVDGLNSFCLSNIVLVVGGFGSSMLPSETSCGGKQPSSFPRDPMMVFAIFQECSLSGGKEEDKAQLGGYSKVRV